MVLSDTPQSIARSPSLRVAGQPQPRHLAPLVYAFSSFFDRLSALRTATAEIPTATAAQPLTQPAVLVSLPKQLSPDAGGALCLVGRRHR